MSCEDMKTKREAAVRETNVQVEYFAVLGREKNVVRVPICIDLLAIVS